MGRRVLTAAAMLACALVVMCAPQAAAAQAGASVVGMVFDESGGAVGGAQVTLKGAGGAPRGQATTNDGGEFTFEGLAPGRYIVEVDKALFDPGRAEFDVNAGRQPPMVHVILRVGGVREAVVVAVPKIDERPTGQTVTTLDRSQFKDQTSLSIGDVLAYSPGVTIQQANGPRDVLISVRGSNSRVTFGLRNIQVFEDGFPVTQPDGLARTDLTDPHAYGAIDVFRGPSSALYGNYAVEGAINFHTRPAADVDGLEVGVDAGGYGYRNAYLTYGHKGPSYEVTAFGSMVGGDGFTAHTSYQTTTANVMAIYTPSARNKFTFKFINNDNYPNLSIRLSLNQFNLNPYQEGCDTLSGTGCASVSVFANGVNGARLSVSPAQAGLQRHDRRTIVGARWEHTLAPSTTWRTQLVFDNRDIRQPTSATSGVGTFPSFNLTSDVTRNGSLAGRTAVHFAGVFANFMNNNGNTFNVAPGGDATLGALTAMTIGHIFNAGVRAREELKLTPTVTASAGVGLERSELVGRNTAYAYPTSASPTVTRIDAERALTNVAPEVTLMVRPNRVLKIQGRIGTAYGAPQIGNLFVTPEGVNGNNTQLTSQSNIGYDIAADVTTGRLLSASVAAYYEIYKNELLSQSPGANLLTYTFNAPRSIHRGFEATADLRPAPRLPGAYLRLSYTWMDQSYDEYVERLSAGNQSATFNRAGNKIPGVTPTTVNARVGYDQPSGALAGLGGYVEVNNRAGTWVDNANLLKVPGYTLYNLNVHWDPKHAGRAKSRLHLIFELRNLANRVWVASASNLSDGISATTGLPNPASVLATSGGIWAGTPRAAVAGVRVKL